MELIVISEHRFERTPDGRIWSWYFGYEFWQRYLRTFEEVVVLARARDVTEKSPRGMRSDGDNVRFAVLPCYRGPFQYLAKRGEIKRIARSVLKENRAVLIRGGSVPNPLIERCQKTGHPYAAEVIGDPRDMFAPGASEHRFRALWRWMGERCLKKVCERACGVSYVTEAALQKRYPAGAGAVTAHYSSIELPEAAIRDAPRTYDAAPRRFFALGMLDMPYKGFKVLLKAWALLKRKGFAGELTLGGDGKLRAGYERFAEELGIGGSVHFAGLLSAGQGVRDAMDGSDLFILPSFQEGLPRVLIEAMARGLPCVSTTVGGTPELLDASVRVLPGDEQALAQKIEELSGDIPRLNEEARKNWERAHLYLSDILQARRLSFYREIRAITQAWLEDRKQP